MVDGSGLENRQGASPRGFESHPLRPSALRHERAPTREVRSFASELVSPDLTKKDHLRGQVQAFVPKQRQAQGRKKPRSPRTRRV